MFCFFLCLGKFGLGEFDFREQPAGLEAREKGRILAEAYAVSSSRVLSARPPAPCLNLLEAKVKSYLARLRIFAEKWDHFGGDAPRSSPRG
jgi:hypothetical protein